MTPTAELLDLPKEYGRPKKPLDWTDVRHDLEQATAYWLATVRRDGRPHVVPLDGLWVDDVWFYGGSERSVHRRTALAHPAATMHLADPMRAVVVEGEVRLATPGPELAQRLADHANEKYAHFGYRNDASAYAETLALYPRRVLAWTAFPRDATRFLFA
jgi:Pyridoxamine 5'-phosphate oxidase